MSSIEYVQLLSPEYENILISQFIAQSIFNQYMLLPLPANSIRDSVLPANDSALPPDTLLKFV
jgi:hypothetical protein